MRKTIIPQLLLCLWLAACADGFTGGMDFPAGEDEAESIGFSMGVEEVADLLIGIGQTRAGTPQAGGRTECPPQNRPLEGDAFGLLLNRLELPAQGGQPRAFGGYAPPASGTTRASADGIVSYARQNFPDSVTLWGYATAAATGERTLFNATLIKRVRDWRTSVHWPYDKEKMQFYSLAPCVEQVDISVKTGGSFAEPPTFSFTVPDDIGRQHDLLFGRSREIDVHQPGQESQEQRQDSLGKDNKMIHLDYRHILTAVRFARGRLPEGFRITNIRLQNIANTGTYDPATGTWTLEENTGGTIKNDHYDVPTDYTSPRGGYGGAGDATFAAGDEAYFVDNNQALFLMPHTCSEAARLIVTIEGVPRRDGEGNKVLDGEGHEILESHVASVSLKDDVWQPGYLVTYLLSVKELGAGYQLTVGSTRREVESNTAESSGTLDMTSFAARMDYSDATPQKKAGGAIGIAVAGYSEDGSASTDLAAKPDWLHVESIALQGATPEEKQLGNYLVSYQFSPQQWDTSRPNGNHLTMLQTNSLKANVDLSLKDPNGNDFVTGGTARTTANCYIVNRPGGYLFPAVYGNAIEDGTTKSLSGNTTFKDHRGNNIRQAWIASQLTTSTVEEGDPDGDDFVRRTIREGYEYGARVLWQDAPHLLSGVEIRNAAGLFIAFTVDNNDIQPGNAVVALTGVPLTTTTTVISQTPSSLPDGIYNRKTDTYDPNLTTWQEVSGGILSNVEERVVHGSSSPVVLWTWHIWVTDEVYPNREESSKTIVLRHADGTERATVMPVNLGWVPADNAWGSYSVRQTFVTFRQNGGESSVVEFLQHARPDLPTGHGVDHQWGTAMPLPAAGVTAYDGEGNVLTPASIVRFAPAGTWSSSEKTLSDPCPAGFRMPEAALMSGISLTGSSPTVGGSNLNLWPDAVNVSGTTVRNAEAGKGGWFYAKTHDGAAALTADERYAGYDYVPNPGMFYMPQGTYWTGTNGSHLYVLTDYNATGTVLSWGTSTGTTPTAIRPQGKAMRE